MSLQSLARRRPSASMIVSLTALFVALGGTGWAALSLAPNSVGRAQLKNGSVTQAKIQNGAVWNWKLAFNSVGTRKIQNGAVGASQVKSSQVQLRVGSGCASGAIQSIGLSGSVVCTPGPNQYGTSASAATLGSGATQIASKALPGSSSYLVMAFPHAVITPALTGASGQQVQVDCTLSVSPSSGATETKSAIVEIGSAARSQAQTIPLVVPVTAAAGGATASVSCSDSYTTATPAPAVAVDTTLNAIQTAANN